LRNIGNRGVLQQNSHDQLRLTPVDRHVDLAGRDLDHRSQGGRPGTSASGRPAADSPETAALDGDLAGASRSRAPGHESRRDLPLDMELDAANPNEVPNGTGRRRRWHTSQRGGRRRKACSGELVPAADGTGASTSPSSGFLTSTRISALLHDEGGTTAEGNRQRRRRPRVVRRRRRWVIADRGQTLGRSGGDG
jgi:hypothetical protein